MMLNKQLPGFTVDENKNGPPSHGAPWTEDDLFIQSDNEVTPMTDIEDSSGDEVYDEDYLRMHMKSAHDEVKSSDGVHQMSISGTTNQIKHAMPENRTPSPFVKERDNVSIKEEEELNGSKKNLVYTQDGVIHDNTVNDPWPRLDPVENVKTETIPSDLEHSSRGHQDSITDARPVACGGDLQPTHGQVTVYRYDDDFTSDSICQEHIKKESHAQDTFQTAAYEDILMKAQSEDTGTATRPGHGTEDVLRITSKHSEEMDCNVQIKKEQVSVAVPNHKVHTAMDKEETESGKRLDTITYSLHDEKNIHTLRGAPDTADGEDGLTSDGAAAVDHSGDGGVDHKGDGVSDEPGNSGILVNMEVCDSVEDCASVISHDDRSVSSLDGCNSDVCAKKESCVNMNDPLPFPTQPDKPCERTENDKVQVNLSLDTTSESDEPDVQRQPATNSSSDPGVPPLQETTGKDFPQQQSSSRRKKYQKKGRKPKPGKVCHICKKRFPSSELEQHIQKSHRHSCKICSKTIKDSVMFQGHMREHAGEPSPYWCDQCDKRYDRFTTLNRHRRMHSMKGRWECSTCGKVLTRRDYYLNHLKIHEDSNINKCEVCGRQYASAVNLRKHMVVHLEEKPIECPVCEKRFNFKSTLDYHMRSHTAASVKSATCEICGKECIHKSSLAIHMNVHTGLKPYVCIYCGKRFAQLSTKIGHEMSHENPNKKSLDKESEEQRTKNMLESYDCDQCLMSFTSLELLNGHLMRTHDTVPKEIRDSEITPECIKPYSCGICEMPFLSVSGLRKHRIKNHPEHVGVGKGRYSSLGKNLTSNENTMADKTATVKKGATVGSARNSKKGSKEVNVRQGRSSTRGKGRSSTKGTSLYDTETADQPRLDSQPDTVEDLPPSTQKPDPGTDSPKSKQGSSDGESESNVDKNKCNICGKLVLELRNHMKYHSEKAYVCRVCGMRFAISANLKRHLRQHTGETPFQCKTCGQRFMKAEALKKHMARHEGKDLEKKYECSICGKKFLDNYHLKRHSVVHNSWPKVRVTDPANIDK